MAARLSLRDYQHDLADRLRNAKSESAVHSKLGVQVGEQPWLIDLAEAGELIPVPPITAVPLTRPWFRGVVNVRGNLYNVVDLPAFLGGPAVGANEQARLLLVAERFLMRAALLVDGSLGLRDTRGFAMDEDTPSASPWIRATYADSQERIWRELDVRELVQHAAFLGVAA
ncbi:MAG TPA: chemotaxis protein CheW [Burkholderiales bacterium]|nr:chemotaxis protein CheW [Burkholderiales bacterium]